MFPTPPASVPYFLGWVHAILGAAIWLPAAVGGLLAVALAPVPVRPAVFVATTVLLVVMSGLFGITRAGAIRLGNGLLRAGIPVQPAAPDRSTRLRSAGWTLLHAGSGATLLAVAFQAVFLAAALPIIWIRCGGTDSTVYGFSPTIGRGWSGCWTLFAALGVVTLVLAAGVGYAALLRRAAPTLLGPSAVERLAVVQRHADQLAHRNRLARELHDSIGHTLTATTIQAALAGTLVDSDPERARHAMGSIEDASRTALDDLDHVLGVLREGTPPRQPQHTLARPGGLAGAGPRCRHTGRRGDHRRHPPDAGTGVPRGVPDRAGGADQRDASPGPGHRADRRRPGPVGPRADQPGQVRPAVGRRPTRRTRSRRHRRTGPGAAWRGHRGPRHRSHRLLLAAGGPAPATVRAKLSQIAHAVRLVHAGESLLFPDAVRALVTARPALPAAARHPRLTGRETEILRLIATGLSNAEIAQTLVISLETVKTHVSNVFTKLDAANRTQAVIIAYETGVVTPG